MGDAADDEPANDWSPRAPMTDAIAVRNVDRVALLFVLPAVGHTSSQRSVMLPDRIWFSICRRYVPEAR